MQTDLETRLANLESSVRNWKRFSALVVAVAAAVCVAGWRSGPGLVEATSFHLVDKQGKDRAVLTTSGDDTFFAVGAAGDPTTIIASNHDKADMEITDAKGVRRIGVNVWAPGPSFMVMDEAGKPRGVMCYSPANDKHPDGALVFLSDQNGAVKATLHQ